MDYECLNGHIVLHWATFILNLLYAELNTDVWTSNKSKSDAVKTKTPFVDHLCFTCVKRAVHSGGALLWVGGVEVCLVSLSRRLYRWRSRTSKATADRLVPTPGLKGNVSQYLPPCLNSKKTIRVAQTRGTASSGFTPLCYAKPVN